MRRLLYLASFSGGVLERDPGVLIDHVSAVDETQILCILVPAIRPFRRCEALNWVAKVRLRREDYRHQAEQRRRVEIQSG